MDREELIKSLAVELAKSLHKQFYINEKYTQYNFTHQQYRKLLGLMAVELHQLIDDEENAELDEIMKNKKEKEAKIGNHKKFCQQSMPLVQTTKGTIICLECKETIEDA